MHLRYNFLYNTYYAKQKQPVDVKNRVRPDKVESRALCGT